MPAYNTDALSAELLVKVIDAAIRTVMSPRTTNIDVDLKVKKSDDFIRLDQLAPAVWKPAFLRAIAMHAAFTPTISNVMRKHPFSSLGLSVSPDSLDQRDERHGENEAKLWCLMYRKLSKDVPGMRLAPVRLNNARNIMDGANSDNLFGDAENQRRNAVTDSIAGVRSQEENESDEEDLFTSEDARDLVSDGFDLLEDDLLC
ncbi:hypothetical protein C1H76_9476 [Elsinoe australis]|uniref:Uncharacterized protein n=1 Tax=Elsinoe australis TaxID=40998 RepID=A0A4U7AQM6_9PEZI|nr:hypothetical protein C1H76_9476 [Elsinoe australis]